MSLVLRLSALATRIGAEIRELIRPDHPSLARAWVSFGVVGNNVVMGASYNVAEVTRLAAGRYRIAFATPMADARYAWFAVARSNVASGSMRSLFVRPGDAKSAGALEVICSTGNASLADTTELNVVVFR